MKRIAIIECCNFEDYPTGGQLTFARQMLRSFKNELDLIGITTEEAELGKWTKKTINGTEYNFFPYLFLPKTSKKPLVPLRFRNYLALRKYKKELKESNLTNVLVQSPDTLLAIDGYGFRNICYRFAGVENPLSISRYKIGRYFSFLYDQHFLPRLDNIQLVLAAADTTAIKDLLKRAHGSISPNKIIQFPTRVDNLIFHKTDPIHARKVFNIPENEIMVVTTGRLGWFKGWKFMIDSFNFFLKDHPEAHLYFLGNGEDHDMIKDYISTFQLKNNIHLLGYQPPAKVAEYLNAADLYIMGSFKEGWSTSLIEAVACGIPACVTNFSSAHDIIKEGINGYVSPDRDELRFSKLMDKSLSLRRDNLPNEKEIEGYLLSHLKEDLLEKWKLI